MTVFAIKKDGYKYQELDLEVNDFIDDFPEDIDYGQAHDFASENIAMADFWKPMSTGWSEIKGNENLIPDLTTWIDATLVLSPKAHRFLGDLMSPYGEFLPIHIDGEVYQIFNCLTMSDWDQKDNTHKLIFKSRADRCMTLFCLDRLKDAISSFQLAGLEFQSVK